MTQALRLDDQEDPMVHKKCNRCGVTLFVGCNPPTGGVTLFEGWHFALHFFGVHFGWISAFAVFCLFFCTHVQSLAAIACSYKRM